MGGQVDLLCDQTTNTTNQIKAGEIKAYATTTPRRLAAQPDMPTATRQVPLNASTGDLERLYAPKERRQEWSTGLPHRCRRRCRTRP